MLSNLSIGMKFLARFGAIVLILVMSGLIG